MANYLISALLGKKVFAATDESTGAACWTLLKIKEVEVDSSSMNSANPILTDDTAAANTFTSLLTSDVNSLKIIQPSKMRVTAFCDDAQSIENLMTSFENTKSTITIQTKGITAKNLVVVTVEILQDPSMTSASKVIIELEQAEQTATQTKFNPTQSADKSAYGVSIQTPTKLPISISNLYNKVSMLFKGF